MNKKIELQNGIRVHLIPFASTEAVSVLVLVKVGSRYETVPLNGASHYIEHLLFKGTNRRPQPSDVSRALDSVGAEFNAFTGKDRTGYYVKVSKDHTEFAIDILHDMLFHSRFATPEMNRERGVIIEEINMYHDNPLMYADDLLEQTMFAGSTLGWEIAGSHETMRSMSRAEVIRYHRDYYIAPRLVIAVAGNISERKVRAMLNKTFGTVASTNGEPNGFAPFGELPARAKPRVKVQYKDTKQIQIAMGFPSFGKGGKQVPAAKLLASILGGTMSSRLFMSVREKKGLAYFVKATQSEYEDVGTFTIQSGLDISRLDLAAKMITKELRSIKKHGVTTEELRRAKDNLRGRVALALEDSMHRAEFYADQELFLDKVISPKQKIAEFDRVSKRGIQKVANEIIDFNKLCLAGIGPYKTSQALLKHFPI